MNPKFDKRAQRKSAQVASVAPNNNTDRTANTDDQNSHNVNDNISTTSDSNLDDVFLQVVHQHMQPVVLLDRVDKTDRNQTCRRGNKRVKQNNQPQGPQRRLRKDRNKNVRVQLHTIDVKKPQRKCARQVKRYRLSISSENSNSSTMPLSRLLRPSPSKPPSLETYEKCFLTPGPPVPRRKYGQKQNQKDTQNMHEAGTKGTRQYDEIIITHSTGMSPTIYSEPLVLEEKAQTDGTQAVGPDTLSHLNLQREANSDVFDFKEESEPVAGPSGLQNKRRRLLPPRTTAQPVASSSGHQNKGLRRVLPPRATEAHPVAGPSGLQYKICRPVPPRTTEAHPVAGPSGLQNKICRVVPPRTTEAHPVAGPSGLQYKICRVVPPRTTEAHPVAGPSGLQNKICRVVTPRTTEAHTVAGPSGLQNKICRVVPPRTTEAHPVADPSGLQYKICRVLPPCTTEAHPVAGPSGLQNKICRVVPPRTTEAHPVAGPSGLQNKICRVVPPRTTEAHPVAGPSGLQYKICRVVPPRTTEAHPVAGPSGLQYKICRVVPPRTTDAHPVAIPSAVENISVPEEESILQPQPTRHDLCTIQDVAAVRPSATSSVSTEVCPATKWKTAKDVIEAPHRELVARCAICDSCRAINKLVYISVKLLNHTQIDLVSDTNNPASQDHYNYLELLPINTTFLIQVRISSVDGNITYSHSLVPKDEFKTKITDMTLLEQEHILGKICPIMEDIKSEPVSDDDGETAAIEAKIKKYDIEKQNNDKRISVVNSQMVMLQQSVYQLQSQNEEIKLIQERLAAEAARRAEEQRLMAEVEAQARALENEPDAKDSYGNPVPAPLDDSIRNDPWLAPYLLDDTQFPAPHESAKIVDAPVFTPSVEEFNDPIAFVERIWPVVHKYGICKVIPPEGFDLRTVMSHDTSLYVMNQYISRLYNRWGTAVRELCAIKLCLLQENNSNNSNTVKLPVLDGVEVNLPKLNLVVQRHGGLETVINKNRWPKVLEEVKCRKAPSTGQKLDKIYVKWLLPYVSLANKERQKLQRTVQVAWNSKNQKLLDRAMNPLHQQKKMSGDSDSSSDDDENQQVSAALALTEYCNTIGNKMSLIQFKKIAATFYKNHVADLEVDGQKPSISKIEELYWRHVVLGTDHLHVLAATVNAGDAGIGAAFNRHDSQSKHPWNLKNISKNPRNLLRFLESKNRLTVPTWHLGMLFSSSCWHKDPHALSWFDYTHEGNGKVWYGIPDSQAEYFRKAVETLSPTCCQNKSLWLPSDIAMIPPQLLRDHSVSLTRAVQNKNEFIIVFPNAYTSSFCTEYTESESVYFAPRAWLPEVPKVFQEARDSCEPTMFSVEQFMLQLCADPSTELDVLEVVRPFLDLMVLSEKNNRHVLQARGLTLTNKARATSERRECGYCRAILFLSMVKGIPEKRSTLCLEHAIKLLDSEKYQHLNVAQLEMHVYVSNKDLDCVAVHVANRMDSEKQ